MFGFKAVTFIERSITGALAFFKESAFSEEFAGRDGFLQRFDPRIKAVTFVLFLVTAVGATTIPAVTMLYGACLLLAVFSRINLAYFLKRTWVFIPLFSLFIAFPALFSTFTPGEPALRLAAGGMRFTVTRPGIASAGLFVARVTTCVSFAILLSLTTRQAALLKVLRIFGVPEVFVTTAGMCYRYLYLFVQIIEHTYTALKSRVGRSMDFRRGQQAVAWKIATLWQRSLQLNEEVYGAMLSRGFRGEPRILGEFKTRPRDWVWLGVVAAGTVPYLLWMR